jgi:glycosyltransferase A (GT-A) superfamily protein (DUF2064 family)
VGPAVRLLPQRGEGLSDALSGAAATLLADGFDQVALISSDNPTLPSGYVVQAFAALPDADAVLGPAEDGGYYLIALRQPHPGLFQDITWSTAVVFEQTLARAAALGLRVAITPPWYDVDDLAAFHRLRAELAASAGGVATHTRRFLQAHRLGDA